VKKNFVPAVFVRFLAGDFKTFLPMEVSGSVGKNHILNHFLYSAGQQ